MLKKLKILFLVGILLLAVFIGALVILYSYTPIMDKAILEVINRLGDKNIRVDYRRISGNLFGTVRIDDLRVIIAPQDTITCKRLELDYSLLDFAKSKFDVQQLLLIQPTVILHASPADTAAPADTSQLALDSLTASLDLSDFPFVRLGRLIIKDGNILLRNPDETEHIKDVQLQLSAEISDQKIEIQPRYARGSWENRNITVEDLSFKLTGNKKRITLNQLEAKIPGANLVGHGEIEFDPVFRFLIFADTTRIEFPMIRKLWPEFPYQKGHVKAYGSFIGLPGNFKGDVFIGGEFDSLKIDYFKTEYRRKGDRYTLENLGFQSNFGRLNGSAELSDKGNNHIALDFTGINLARAGLSEEAALFNGKIKFDFKNWDLQDLTGQGEVSLHSLRAGSAALDRVLLNLKAERGNWDVLPPSHVEFGPGSKFTLQGSLSDRQMLALRVNSEDNNLDTLFSRLSLKEMGGHGNLNLQINGALADPSLNGNLYLDSLRMQNSTLYGIEGKADVTNVITNRQGYFDLNVATGFLGNVFLTSGEINFKFNRSQILFEPFQFYSEENSVFTRGFVNFGDSLTLMVLDSLRIQYENYIIRNDKQISAELYDDTLRLNVFSLIAAESGFIKSEGFFALDGNSKFSVNVNNIRLEPFNQYLYWDNSLNGYVDARVSLFGELSNPEIDLGLTLDSLSLNQYPIGKVTGDFSLKDKRLVVNLIDLEGMADSYLSVNGSVDVLLGVQDSLAWDFSQTPLDVSIVLGNWRLQDYAFLYGANFPVEGSFTGRLDLAGNIARPKVNFDLQGENVRYADYIFPQIQTEGRVSSSKLSIDLATINFLNTIIKINGEKNIRWDPQNLDSLLVDKNFRMRVKIEEDSLNFLTVLNPELDLLTGDIQLDALLAGEYDNPRLVEGTFKVGDGTLFLSKLENSIGEIDLSTHIEGQKLVIDKFSARSPQKAYSQNFFQKWMNKIQIFFFRQRQTGYISGKGNIDFTYLDRPRFDLDMSLHNAYFNYFLENTRIVASSNNLRINGRDTLLISGDVIVNEADIELDFAQSEKNLLLSTGVRETPPFLQYDLAVEILPKFVIRSNETLNNFNMRLSGDLRVTQEPRGNLEMFGTLQTSGKYFIQGEDFSIQSGKIDFVNPKELPELNLVAQKQKNNLVFNLNVRGRLNAPEKEIIIQDEQGNTLPYPDVKDQMALLLFGVTFNELGTNTDALLLNKGEQVITQAIVATIEKEARTFTGLDQIRLDTQDSFFKNRLNQPATLALGKYLTPKLYLEYKSRLESSSLGNIPAPSLSWEAGNQIYLQYRLNHSWSFYTIFQKTLEGNDKFNVDISWQISF